MAGRGLVQCALRSSYSLPAKAIRKTVISPRTFQDLARAAGPLSSTSPTGSFSQQCRAVSWRTASRPLHASATISAQRTSEEDNHEVLAAGEKLEEGEDISKASAVETLTSKSGSSATLREVLRKCMRRVPQPVAIVTSAETYGDSKDFRGATISSFNTVSLNPKPIVSFNIGRHSSTFDAIKASDRFWVHFLTLEQSAAELAQRFTRGNRKTLFSDLDMEGTQLLAGDPTVRYPKIRGLQGAKKKGLGKQIAMVLECVYLKDKTVVVGDHVVLFGTVTCITDAESMAEPVQSGSCLVYANGTYHEVLPLERGIVRKVIST